METAENPLPQLNEIKSRFTFFPFSNGMQAILVLLIVGIVFYSTSLNNEYALDDGIVIHQNEYVVRGIDGVGDILTHDLYSSFYRRMNASDQLYGGRYRPLAAISFAIEQQLIHTYRSGYYMRVEDLNHNGVLDDAKVTYTTASGKKESNYEYNEYIDVNGDGRAQGEECYACWDLNQNFRNDMDEDLNKDGVYNEVDCQIYGASIRHLNNIWLYVLAGLFLYILLRDHIFSGQPDMAFLSALIFMTHPIHSEVVANVRGREDIFSLLFICLCFIYAFKYMKAQKISSLLLSGLMLFLALMSREYGFVMFFLLPLAFWIFGKEKYQWTGFWIISLVFAVMAIGMTAADIVFEKQNTSTLPASLACLVIFAVLSFTLFRTAFFRDRLCRLALCIYGFSLLYLTLRLYAVNMIPPLPDTEPLNNPFVYASGQEQFATKVYVMLRYLELFFIPHPLVSDYSYSTIAFRNLISWDFILSLLIHLSLLFAGIRLSAKKHVMGFAILTYLLFLVFVSNLIFPTHIMMLEGHLFHASIGGAIALGWLGVKGLERIRMKPLAKKAAVIIVLGAIVFLYGCKTWERNRDWKNDVTLFFKDVKNAPNSVLVLGNAGARWIDLADTKEITGNFIPGQDTSDINDYNGTLKISWDEVYEGGFVTKREAALNRGINYLKHAIELHPRYVNGYLNLGLAYFKLGDDRKCIYYWKVAERLYPDNPYLRNYYIVYTNGLKKRGYDAFAAGHFDEAIEAYKYFTIVTPDNPEGWYELGGAYFNAGKRSSARYCWNKALALNPDYEQARNAIKVLDNGTVGVMK
jgi:hypothetical protein